MTDTIDKIREHLKAHGKQERVMFSTRGIEELLTRLDFAERFSDMFGTLALEWPIDTRVRVDRDGFVGHVRGYYITNEEKPGLVLQQAGTRVVHVYGRQWLVRV